MMITPQWTGVGGGLFVLLLLLAAGFHSSAQTFTDDPLGLANSTTNQTNTLAYPKANNPNTFKNYGLTKLHSRQLVTSLAKGKGKDLNHNLTANRGAFGFRKPKNHSKKSFYQAVPKTLLNKDNYTRNSPKI